MGSGHLQRFREPVGAFADQQRDLVTFLAVFSGQIDSLLQCGGENGPLRSSALGRIDADDPFGRLDMSAQDECGEQDADAFHSSV